MGQMPVPAIARSQRVLMVLTEKEESHSNGLVHVFAGLVDDNSRSGGATLARMLVLRIHDLKSIVILDVCNNGLKHSCIQVLVARVKLIKDVRVMRVQGANKDHHLQERRDDDLATAHIQDHSVEARSKLHDWFRVPLDSIKEGHKSGESVSDRVRTAVLI